jgi:putative tricarboxylic transport membrane protein
MSRLTPSFISRALPTGAAWFHGVLALLSLGYLVGSIAMGPPVDGGKLTPSFFPLLVGALAALLCTLQWWSEVRAAGPTSSATGSASVRRWSPELLLMLATLVYVLSFQTLGYWLSTLAYVLVVMLLFSGLEKWLVKTVIALAITALGFLVFNEIFNVRLPTLWG